MKRLSALSRLMLDSEEGQHYWHAMELMGRYASANHELIHNRIVGDLGAEVMLKVENHHNFAWREEHDGQETVVHRKGATPADAGAIGIIPGSMATPDYMVRGLGNAESLNSASHGAHEPGVGRSVGGFCETKGGPERPPFFVPPGGTIMLSHDNPELFEKTFENLSEENRVSGVYIFEAHARCDHCQPYGGENDSAVQPRPNLCRSGGHLPGPGLSLPEQPDQG